MKVLSLDQSTVSTGWALFANNNVGDYGVIKISKQEDDTPKWCSMFKKIVDKIQETSPDIVVLEDTIMQRSTATLKELTRLQGAIVAFCYVHNIQTIYLYPTQWRKIIKIPQSKGMKRKELKKLSMEYAITRFSIIGTEDEADAICIGTAFLDSLKINENKEKINEKK